MSESNREDVHRSGIPKRPNGSLKRGAGSNHVVYKHVGAGRVGGTSRTERAPHVFQALGAGKRDLRGGFARANEQIGLEIHL